MRHSSKERDNVAESRPGSNTGSLILCSSRDCDEYTLKRTGITSSHEEADHILVQQYQGEKV